MTWPNGDKYIGNFAYNHREGKGSYIFGNGNKYVGEFVDGRMTGHGEWTDIIGGFKYVGEFKSDYFNGQGTKTYDDGKIEKGIWENSILIEVN